LLDGDRHHRLFDRRRRAVLQHRLAPADLGQREFAAFVVELLEAIEAVARVAQHFAGLADIAELAGQLQQPDLGADDLLLLCHLRGLRPAHRLHPSETDIDCQIKFELTHMSAPSASGCAGAN
jgi:hypothetical protein